jgi:hypothetical protein
MNLFITTLKASVNSVIALLDEETRKDVVEQLKELSSGTLAVYGTCNMQDLKTNKHLAVGRIAIDVFSTLYDVFTVHDINQLRSDKASRKFLEYSAHFIQDVSGWTKEEIDNILNDDLSSPILGTRLTVALANPKDDSVLTNCKNEVYEVIYPLIEPVLEAYADVRHDAVAQTFQIIDGLSKFESPFTTIDGKIIATNQVEKYEYTKSPAYHLTINLGIDKDLIHHFLSNNDKTYHIPTNAWTIIDHHSKFGTFDEMNKQLATWLKDNPGPHLP